MTRHDPLDNFDKLANGMEFEKQSEGTLINGDWVSAKVYFDSDKLKYVVKLSWEGNTTKQRYTDAEDAVSRYKTLVVEHGLDREF